MAKTENSAVEKENISVFTLIPGSKICVLSATSARTLDGCQLDWRRWRSV